MTRGTKGVTTAKAKSLKLTGELLMQVCTGRQYRRDSSGEMKPGDRRPEVTAMKDAFAQDWASSKQAHFLLPSLFIPSRLQIC